jgi:hypothetical protein
LSAVSAERFVVAIAEAMMNNNHSHHPDILNIGALLG